uniref:Gypsy retrotransposon integrase-like protein 1 n=1 Tax=Knipowitschia caucasica TaxID=637954 RepID=A0AAV2LHK1_KNICA
MPFERQARKYGWSAMERVDRLHECLRGAAVRYVCSLPERTREDYVLLVEQLTQRFGKKDPPTTIRRKIGELRQARETSAEFAEEVRRLITLAYPGVDLQLQDQLATDAFLKGLRNQKVAYEVMNRDPGSFVEAQKFVEAHEHNFKATVGRDTEVKNRARRISWVDEGDLCEDTATMSRRVQTPQLRHSSPQTPDPTDPKQPKALYQKENKTIRHNPTEVALNHQAQIVGQLVHALDVEKQDISERTVLGRPALWLHVAMSKQSTVPRYTDDSGPSLLVGRIATAFDIPEHLHGLVAATSEALNEEQQQRFIQLLLTYQSVFAKNDSDLGYMSVVTHKIDTGLSRPVRQPVRRTPLGFQGEEEAHLKAMLEEGVITPSASEWASPVVLVRKKDGGVRWCVDYRSLNSLTIKDAYPLPQIEECLDVIGGASMFSTLDLQSGYWQIAVDSKDREKTAFITKWGLYEYTRMPFGLCNAPSTFQRAMELVLRGLQWETLLIYLDDVIVIGNGVDQSLDRLEQVFQRFQSYGLKLKPSKCHLLQEEVLFLGHIVSGNRVGPNPALVKDVQQWNPPNNLQELQAFLGLCNYYRKFVPSFAELASPLHNLLKKGTVFQWTDEHQAAFTMLKEKLTTAPVLGYPRTEGKFILDTDASNNSVGAVLSQIQWGEERVLTYASSHLSPAQQRYCVTRRELLAVVRFTRQFRHYLLGRKFLLRTDHGSLTWLFRFKCPEGQLARWLEELSQYDFHIEHRAGKQHANADALSRLPNNMDKCDCYQAGINLSDLPCKGCRYCWKVHEQWAKFEEDVDDVVPLAVRCIEPQGNANVDGTQSVESQPSAPLPETPEVNWLESLSPEQLATLQKADSVLATLHTWKETGTLPTKDEVMLEGPAVRKFWLCWPQVTLRQGVLYYSWDRIGDQHPTQLLLVPSSMQKEILQSCHNPPYSGHLGEAKTLQRVRQSYHWYGMGRDVQLFVKSSRGGLKLFQSLTKVLKRLQES